MGKQSQVSEEFVQGFFTKCAETGLTLEQAGALMKVALAPGAETALSRAALGALLGGGAGGLLGGIGYGLNPGPAVGQDEEGNLIHEPGLKESLLENILAGAGSGMLGGGLMGGAYGAGQARARQQPLM